jgi:hypothetical protein
MHFGEGLGERETETRAVGIAVLGFRDLLEGLAEA